MQFKDKNKPENKSNCDIYSTNRL